MLQMLKNHCLEAPFIIRWLPIPKPLFNKLLLHGGKFSTLLLANKIYKNRIKPLPLLQSNGFVFNNE